MLVDSPNGKKVSTNTAEFLPEFLWFAAGQTSRRFTIRRCDFDLFAGDVQLFIGFTILLSFCHQTDPLRLGHKERFPSCAVGACV